jgi:hypothetical protein
MVSSKLKHPPLLWMLFLSLTFAGSLGCGTSAPQAPAKNEVEQYLQDHPEANQPAAEPGEHTLGGE